MQSFFEEYFSMHKWAVEKEYMRRLKKAFDEKGIEIPYPHCSIVWAGPDKPVKFLEPTAPGAGSA